MFIFYEPPKFNLALYLIETSFNAFANRADPDQGSGSSYKSCLNSVYSVCLYGNMTSDPTLMDLTNNSS